ncbi:MAG: phosphate transport system regulatory protein PhoU, partial [Proteobacteria bacterium]|nr:phosphate transport system regulatory protein PhoU [Pseudomonadota bacterium]MBU1736821.1 phosphate transport system regulatory protein PhoU [Pseudomonadota bacterium]
MDDLVDEYTRQMYGKATEVLAEHPDHINFVLQAVTAGRHLERIADHATNI